MGKEKGKESKPIFYEMSYIYIALFPVLQKVFPNFLRPVFQSPTKKKEKNKGRKKGKKQTN